MKSIPNYAVITASVFTATFIVSCSSDPQTDNTLTLTEEIPFINPPVPGVDVPFEKFEINAELGDTIYHSSGSVIVFPPNSIMDKNGVIASGNVDITYREFSDPIDFFLSGMPMAYDSGGVNYTFESAAMCEVYAFQNNEPLFVNPLLPPQINLASAINNDAFNLYFLDTVSQRWVYKGKDEITDIKKKPEIKKLVREDIELIPPVLPVKADETKQSFTIIIEPGSVRELTVYNNMRFEIDEDEKNFNPKNNVEYWDDVKVENTEKKGTFRVTFTSKKEIASYLGRPVYEGKDYEEALKEFEVKQREYEKLLRQRLSSEEKVRQEIEKQNLTAKAEQERITRMNKIIEKRNKEIEENNKRIMAAEYEKRRRTEEYLKKQREESERREAERERNAFISGGAEMSNQIFRTFLLQGFGAWNIDKPALQQTVRIAANYINKKGKKLMVKNINVAYNNFNGIFSYQNDSIGIIPNSGNTILGVIGNKFAFISAQDFLKCNIDSTTREYTFTMNVHDGNISSREEIKRIVGL